MKAFNQSIKIEVSVDSIAHNLLSTISPDFKHRDIVAEAVIATALHHDTLSYVYNALNGYPPVIDFQVGDIITSSHDIYTYRVTSTGKYERGYYPIGEAEVIDIDLYKDSKLKLRYKELNSKGETVEDTTWVDHKTCSRIPVILPPAPSEEEAREAFVC